jgi:hypothetical protein
LEANYAYAGRRAKRMTAEQFVDSVWQVTGAAPTEFDAPVIRGKVDHESLAKIELAGQWIWGESASAGKPPPAGEEVVFRLTVRLPADVVSGAAVISCDNAFELYIGRRQVAGSADWTRPQTVAMAGRLKQGDNEIVAVARNRGDRPNAAGFYFEARMTLKDGTPMEIITDESWKVSQQSPVGGREGRLGRTPGPWKQATLLGRPAVYARIDTQAKRSLAMGLSEQSSMVRASLLKSDFLMRSLGRPNRDQIVTSRPSDLSTLEAINLANGDVLAQAFAGGAENFLSQDLSASDMVQQIYRFTLSRDPSAGEMKTIVAAAGPQPSPQSIEDLLWAICMMPEFLMVR